MGFLILKSVKRSLPGLSKGHIRAPPARRRTSLFLSLGRERLTSASVFYKGSSTMRKRSLLLDKRTENRLHSLPFFFFFKFFFLMWTIFEVMYGCESWTVKKAKHRRIDAFELWCWRRLLRVPWTARRSNQSILKEISPGISLGGLECCDPMNRSTPGLPVHHQLPQFTQTHVHQVGDAIQPSHPLSSPSPPAPNPSQHQSLFQ